MILSALVQLNWMNLGSLVLFAQFLVWVIVLLWSVFFIYQNKKVHCPIAFWFHLKMISWTNETIHAQPKYLVCFNKNYLHIYLLEPFIYYIQLWLNCWIILLMRYQLCPSLNYIYIYIQNFNINVLTQAFFVLIFSVKYCNVLRLPMEPLMWTLICCWMRKTIRECCWLKVNNIYFLKFKILN